MTLIVVNNSLFFPVTTPIPLAEDTPRICRGYANNKPFLFVPFRSSPPLHPTLYTLHYKKSPQQSFLFGHVKKMLYICTAIPRRGCLHVIGWGSRHIKRRLLTLCSDVVKSRKFQKYSGLSNDRCPTGYRLSLLCLFGTLFAYSYARTRVP